MLCKQVVEFHWLGPKSLDRRRRGTHEENNRNRHRIHRTRNQNFYPRPMFYPHRIFLRCRCRILAHSTASKRKYRDRCNQWDKTGVHRTVLQSPPCTYTCPSDGRRCHDHCSRLNCVRCRSLLLHPTRRTPICIFATNNRLPSIQRNNCTLDRVCCIHHAHCTDSGRRSGQRRGGGGGGTGMNSGSSPWSMRPTVTLCSVIGH